MDHPLNVIMKSNTIEEKGNKNKVIHTFYLTADGSILIDKHACEILELEAKYNLVLVKDEQTGKYLLELRDA